MIAFLCDRLGCLNFRDICAVAFGKRAGILVDLCICTNSFFVCVTYNILVADFSQKALEGLFGIVACPRPLLIWIATLAVTLPLSHVRSLSPLQSTSFLGLVVIAVVVLYV